jgi:hypothetical protein
MNTKSLESAINRMIEKLPNWNDGAVIYQYDDGMFDCDPRSTYDNVVLRGENTTFVFACQCLDEIFPDFGNCEDDAAWLLAQIINEQLGTDVSAAAAIMGKKGGRSKSPSKQQASRTNGKLGGRPKKEKDEVVRSREQ